MTQKLTGDFLPLGSIVRLEETEHDDWLYFIVARAITKGAGDTTVPRYRVAPHPFGDTPTQEVFSIRDSQIVEVVFQGYENQEDENFLNNLFQLMENAGTGQKQAVKETVTPEPTPVKEEVEEDELLKNDPFYKFRKE